MKVGEESIRIAILKIFLSMGTRKIERTEIRNRNGGEKIMIDKRRHCGTTNRENAIKILRTSGKPHENLLNKRPNEPVKLATLILKLIHLTSELHVSGGQKTDNFE